MSLTKENMAKAEENTAAKRAKAFVEIRRTLGEAEWYFNDRADDEDGIEAQLSNKLCVAMALLRELENAAATDGGRE